jgi:hypothetical protein
MKKDIHSDPDHGIHITSYDTLEEAYADMANQEAAANERLLPEQRAMIDCTDEQYFVNVAVNIQELFIAGEAWSSDRADREELESYHVKDVSELDDEQRAEFLYSRRMMRDSRKRGYIFGRGYSVIEPNGELGSTHVANMWPIDKAAFDEAREQKWQPDLLDVTKSARLRECLFHLYMKRLGR